MADVKKQAAARLQKKAEKSFFDADFDEALRLINKALKISPSPEAQELKIQINGEISAFGSWGVEDPEAEDNNSSEPIILLPASPTSHAVPKQPSTPTQISSHKVSAPSFDDDYDDDGSISAVPKQARRFSAQSKPESKSSSAKSGGANFQC